MMVAEHDVAVLVDEIWLTTLGLATHPRPADAAPLAADEATVDGQVRITGGREATVALQVPRALAARVASVMFHLGDVPPTADDMQDAVGELTNMLGGNIKALLPGECHLSLPTVAGGVGFALAVPPAYQVERFTFECEGLPGVVHVMAAPIAEDAAV